MLCALRPALLDPQWAVSPGSNSFLRGSVYRLVLETLLLGDADGTWGNFGNARRVWATALRLNSL